MRFEAGSEFAGYTVVSRLGRGGMATVYLVREPGLERLVALKVLPEQLVDDQQFGARFEQEARVIGSLDHPSIIPVYRYGITQDVPWMALRYVDGGDFAARLIARPLALSEGFNILRGVAAALDYAHRKGVVHRDIKPQNILLSGEGAAYLADFGVAKLLQASNVSHTLIGGIVGSPTYMAPEQAQGQAIGPFTDIYSLAVICYQWLTGSLPFEADTPHAILLKHVLEPLPTAALGMLAPQVAAALQRGMAKVPDERFPTASMLIATLEQAMYGSVSLGSGPLSSLTPSGLQAISSAHGHSASHPQVFVPPEQGASVSDTAATAISGTGAAVRAYSTLDTPTTLSRPVMPEARDPAPDDANRGSSAPAAPPSPPSVPPPSPPSAPPPPAPPKSEDARADDMLRALSSHERTTAPAPVHSSPGASVPSQTRKPLAIAALVAAALLALVAIGMVLTSGGDEEAEPEDGTLASVTETPGAATATTDPAPTPAPAADPDTSGAARDTLIKLGKIEQQEADAAREKAATAERLRIAEEKASTAEKSLAEARRQEAQRLADERAEARRESDRIAAEKRAAAVAAAAAKPTPPAAATPPPAGTGSVAKDTTAPAAGVAAGTPPATTVAGTVPPPKPAAAGRLIEGFQDLGGGVLKDARTGVLWAKSDNASSIDWPRAKQYCRDLGPGWKLPQPGDLTKIIDRSGRTTNTCGGFTCRVSSAFELSTATFWTARKVGARLATVVYLDNGRVESISIDKGSPRALCLRKP